jgi:hypothetical protein
LPSPEKIEVEMPLPSYWPILLAFSLLLMAAGVIFTLILTAIGFIGLLVCIAGWTIQNRKPHIHLEIEQDAAPYSAGDRHDESPA